MGGLCSKNQFDLEEELDVSRHVILKTGTTTPVQISKSLKLPDDPKKTDPESSAKNETPAAGDERSPSS